MYFVMVFGEHSKYFLIRYTVRKREIMSIVIKFIREIQVLFIAKMFTLAHYELKPCQVGQV